MALPKVVADLNLQLATKIDVGGTTASLTTNVDDDGVTLTDGLYYFTVDSANSSKEHFSCTKTGTSLTNITTVSRQGVETSGALREHRVGASVIMTDFATYKKYIDETALTKVTLTGDETVSGVKTFSSSPIIPTPTTNMQASTKKYVDDRDALKVTLIGDETIDGIKTFSSSPIVPTPTSGTDVANKTYVDGVAIAGGSNASDSVKGITKLSVVPVSGTNPIAIGDNDPRIILNKKAVVCSNSGVSISASSSALLPFQVELLDTDNIYDSGTNTRLTIKTAGIYNILSSVKVSSTSVSISLLKNGSATITVGSSNTTSLIICSTLQLSVNDYIEINCSNNHGIPEGAGGDQFTNLSISRIN